MGHLFLGFIKAKDLQDYSLLLDSFFPQQFNSIVWLTENLVGKYVPDHKKIQYQQSPLDGPALLLVLSTIKSQVFFSDYQNPKDFSSLLTLPENINN